MAALLCEYNPAAYNGLPELEAVDKLVSPKDIEALKPILVKYAWSNHQKLHLLGMGINTDW